MRIKRQFMIDEKDYTIIKDLAETFEAPINRVVRCLLKYAIYCDKMGKCSYFHLYAKINDKEY